MTSVYCVSLTTVFAGSVVHLLRIDYKYGFWRQWLAGAEINRTCKTVCYITSTKMRWRIKNMLSDH